METSMCTHSSRWLWNGPRYLREKPLSLMVKVKTVLKFFSSLEKPSKSQCGGCGTLQFPSVKVKGWIKNYTLSATYSRKNLKILRYYLLLSMHINERQLLNSILPTMLVEGLSSNGMLPLNETWNQKLVKGSISYRSGSCNMPLTSDCTEFDNRFKLHVTPPYSECHTSLFIKACEV